MNEVTIEVGGAAPTGGRGVDAAEFLAEAFSRNADVITDDEQDVLRALRVLVAGCGSVGGAVVEPLARLGVLDFALADPDVYEVSNLNRQACYLEDVGRSKAAVLAERVKRINPFAEAAIYGEGLTVENIPPILDRCDIVFDGIDGAMSPWQKYTLHAEAAARRIPVLSGADFGGKAVVYVFDYREDQRPFYGRGRSEDHRDGRFTESVRWLGYRPIPRDFAPIIADRLATGAPWPQIAYCVSGMGAIGSRTILDVALGRPVRHVVHVDVHDAPRPLRARVADRVRWPQTALRTITSIRGGIERPPSPEPLPRLPVEMLTVLEAARAAPSAHNAQPVRFLLKGPRHISIDWERGRALDVADPAGEGVCLGIGCALEAMSMVSELEFSPSAGTDPLTPEWYAGEVELGSLRSDLPRQQGLLGYRGTNRGPFARDRLGSDQARSLIEAAERHEAALVPIQSSSRIARLAELTTRSASEQFADPAFLEELLGWMRLTAAERRRSPDGFTPESLVLDPVSVAAMRLLRSSSALRRRCDGIGLAKAMGEQAGAGVEQSGAIVLLGAHLGDASSGIRAGRALMSVWIAATHLGLAVQPVFSALATPEGSEEVLDLFGVEPPLEAITLLRIGKAKGAPPPSPRLPLAQICSLDRAAWGV